jgi:hypothetical protein
VLPVMQLAGRAYIAGAVLLGVVYLAAATVFCWRRNDQTARGLLRASLVYLPVLLVLLVVSPQYERNENSQWSVVDVVRGSPDPALAFDRRSPNGKPTGALGDLRSAVWQGQETMPQQSN